MDSAVYEVATTDPKNKLDGLYYLGWCADYLHPSDWLPPVFGAGGSAGNPNDIPGFHDATFEQAAGKADQTVDPTQSLKMYQQAQSMLVNDVPVVFMNVALNDLLVSPNVTLVTSSLDSGCPGGYFWEDADIKAS